MASWAAPAAVIAAVVIGNGLQYVATNRRETRQRAYERDRDARDRRTEAYADYLAAVSGWASLLILRQQARAEANDVDEIARLDQAQRDFEETTLRPAQARFRLLAPQSLVDHARRTTDELRTRMDVRPGGDGVSRDYDVWFKQMVADARADLGAPR